MAKKGKLDIKIELCKGCCLCEKSCPKSVLELSTKPDESGIYSVRAAHMEDCIACGNCCAICPEACFDLYEEISDEQSEFRPAEQRLARVA